MAREFPEYRLVLEHLIELYGSNAWVTVTQLAEVERCDPRTIRKRYSITKGVNGIDIAILAARKCRLAN